MSSAVDTHNLMTLAGDTLAKLGEIWDEMGLNSEERRVQLSQLQQDVAYVYNDRLKMEVEHRDTLRARIAAVTDRVNRYALALGRPLLSEKAIDESTLKAKFEKITFLSADIEKAYEDRAGQTEEHHKQIHALWETLGVQGERDVSGQFTNPPEDLSEHHLIRCKDLIHQLTQEVEQKSAEVSQLVIQIRDIWEALSMDANTADEVDRQIESGEVSLSAASITSLKSKRDALTLLHQEREEEVRGYAVKIVELWNLLGVSPEDRTIFFQRNTGLGQEVVVGCRGELARLENLKQESMKGLVLKVRAQVENLWDELHLSEQEREAYRKKNYTPEYTEEALEQFESYHKYLEERAEIVRPILKHIYKREEILKEKIDFEATSSDPARLLSKKRDPGRLLREEKMRRMINKELPKIESTLRTTLSKWNSENDVPFLYNGVDYLEELGPEERPAKKVMTQAMMNESLSTPKKAPVTPSVKPGSISRGNLNRTLNATPTKSPKAATVGPSSGRVVRKNVPQQPMSLGYSSAAKLNSTLPAQPHRTPEGKALFDMSMPSPISSSPAGTASKKRPFGTSTVNASPSKEIQDRVAKSLKNLGCASPGGTENTPLASRLASPAKRTPTSRVTGRQ
ncbi:hypothetical protein PROFUN_05091 [Planoprotostelium fungivorum]|uniref:Protein regulator of cytokinesis 1 n=1 Tax=Planoprotostelium fungivorum TaxID=1890364 RepID=A0A2P6NRK7_9EUKA|nr:hypothetical protein PROFUN_05091 [Planoprotostelium fungivorum]